LSDHQQYISKKILEGSTANSYCIKQNKFKN